MKKCNRCGIEKEFTEFGKLSNTKDGFNGICKECRNNEARAYRRKKGLENGRIVKPPKRKDPKAKEKECTKCGNVKLLKLFAKDKLSGDGRSAACLDCRNKQAAKYRDENRELIRQKIKARYTKKPKKLKHGKLKKQQRIQINGLKICLYCGIPKPFDEYRENRSFQCRVCHEKRRTLLRRSKGEKSKKQLSIEYINKSTKRCSSCKQTLEKSLFGKDASRGDGVSGTCKECRKQVERKRLFNKRRVAAQTMRSFLDRLERGKTKKTIRVVERILGYSRDKFIKHIENRFLPGMSWKNRNKWHIDHIKPVIAFIDEGEKRPSIVNALENIQPLWAEDNLKKGANYIEA